MGSLTKMSLADVVPTLELLEQAGLREGHWNALRKGANQELIERLVDFWQGMLAAGKVK